MKNNTCVKCGGEILEYESYRVGKKGKCKFTKCSRCGIESDHIATEENDAVGIVTRKTLYVGREAVNNLSDGAKGKAVNVTNVCGEDACKGYCITAMQHVGFTRAQITAVLAELHYAFTTKTKEDAERLYMEF